MKLMITEILPACVCTISLNFEIDLLEFPWEIDFFGVVSGDCLYV